MDKQNVSISLWRFSTHERFGGQSLGIEDLSVIWFGRTNRTNLSTASIAVLRIWNGIQQESLPWLVYNLFPGTNHVPKQNAINQYRGIVNNNRVALPTTQCFLQEVPLELDVDSSTGVIRGSIQILHLYHSLNPIVRRNLVTGDVDPIYNEALTSFSKILPNARPKIPKLKFSSVINNIIPVVDNRSFGFRDYSDRGL